MTDAYTVAHRAAKLFKQRDALAARLRILDAAIDEEARTYAKAMGMFGFTNWMLRQACEARGLLREREVA
jgi:hypothetical protein